VTAALQAPGTVVRHDAGLTVERLGLPADIVSRHPALPDDLYRVIVQGRFPPRDMRYVVSAGGRPVAFGTPGATGRSVTAITADPAVLTSSVTVDTGAAAADLGGGPSTAE